MMIRLSRMWKTLLVSSLLFLVSSFWVIACSPQQSASTKTLTVAVSPWPGYSAHFVAMAKGFFKEEGIEVKEFAFPSQTDSDTAFLANRVDLNWTGLPNVIPQVSRDPSIQVILQCDYSNGSDGVVGRNIKTAADLKGKTIARENVLFEELLLLRYLEKMGLTRNDVKTIDLVAADAATAFGSRKVDVAVTFEPWMGKAAKEGGGEVVFSTRNTNIIPDGLVARKDFVEKNQATLLAYLRAIDKAAKILKQNSSEVLEPIAKSLGVSPAEVAPQLAGVKIYDVQDNRDITLKRANSMNLFDSLDFASKTAKDMKLTPQVVDVNTVINDSVVKSF